MHNLVRYPFGDLALSFLFCLLLFPGQGYAVGGTHENLSGYYSREQNDGELARASRTSHYIRFYPDNRVVRLLIPFPYPTTLTPDTIRKVFHKASQETTGSAYISGTFDLLDEKIVAHLDFIRRIDGDVMFDCDRAVPCRMEFDESSMRIIKKGLVKDHVTSYQFIPD